MKNVLLKFVGIMLAAFSIHAVAAGEISLIKVRSNAQDAPDIFIPGKMTTQTDDVITALVSNLGPQKQVFAHAKGINGQWTDLPLSFVRLGTNGKEVWRGNFRRYQGQLDLEFAMKYVVNGQTYWDNNNGTNFHATSFGTRLFGSNVSAEEDQPHFNVFGCCTGGAIVTVKNLAYAKQVKVVYSTNNWATTQTVNATFNSSAPAHNTEGWLFNLAVSPTATFVNYAISYTVNGVTYWDNNFGLNYHSVLTRN